MIMAIIYYFPDYRIIYSVSQLSNIVENADQSPKGHFQIASSLQPKLKTQRVFIYSQKWQRKAANPDV